MTQGLKGRIEALARDAWTVSRKSPLFSGNDNGQDPFTRLDEWSEEIADRVLNQARLPHLRDLSEGEFVAGLTNLADKSFFSKQEFQQNVVDSMNEMLIALGLEKLSDIVDASRIRETLGVAPLVAFVVNPFKDGGEKALETISRLSAVSPESVGWTDHGFRLGKHFLREERSELIRTLSDGDLIVPGSIYIKDAAHMLAPALLIANGSAERDMQVLDMCAAPGGKTLQLAILMKGQGRLIANNPAGPRNARLKNIVAQYNLNVEVTGQDGACFQKSMPDTFDAVLCDLPCSGSGHMRRNPLSLVEHSAQVRKGLDTQQKKLLCAAILAAKPDGGRVVLSTCSVHAEENENLVHWALNKFGDQIRVVDPRKAIHIDPKGNWGLDGAIRDSITVQTKRLGLLESDTFPAIRIWPHRYSSDAGFCALLERC